MRHIVAARDLATGQIIYQIRGRQRWRALLSFPKLIRQRWPGQRRYVSMDSFSPYKHPQACDWAAASDVGLVFLPKYAARCAACCGPPSPETTRTPSTRNPETVRHEALDDRAEVRGLRRRAVAAARLKLGAA